jgi:hypothetical protein
MGNGRQVSEKYHGKFVADLPVQGSTPGPDLRLE